MIRSALLAALFTLALTACSEKPAKEMTSETPTTVEEKTESSIEKMLDFDLDIVGDESATTDNLPKAADEMTGDAP